MFRALNFWLADIYVQPDFNGLPDNLRAGLQHLTNNAAALLLLIAGVGVICSLIGMVAGYALHTQVSERSRSALMVSAASGALLYAGIAAINYGTGLFR